jgi:hypothetical protein
MLQAWEYMTLLLAEGGSSTDLEEDLAGWGGRGWEAVGMVQQLAGQGEGLFASSIIVLLKRPKQ